MLRKFAAGSLVASCVIAVGGAWVIGLRFVTSQRIYGIAVLWCLVPFAWGVWMMVAPASWVPSRLPAWGGILGVIAGVLGVYVLDVPRRVFGLAIPAGLRPVAVLAGGAIYAALWIIVAAAYRALASDSPRSTAAKAA
jgi:hypothetical protein